MEINEYLDSLGLETADRATLATLIAKADPNKVKAPLLAHSDYTRKTQELAAERTRLQGESAAVNQALSKALRDLETNKISAATYRSRLETIGDEYGVDVSDVLKTPVAETKTTPSVDPDIVRRLEQAEQNFHTNPEIAAILADAREEYVELFGSSKGFSAQKLLTYARENKMPLRGNPETGYTGAFERLFKTSDRRNELMREQIRGEEKTRVDAEFEKRVSDLTLGNRTGERQGFVQAGSAVLSDRFKNVVSERTTGEKPAEGEKPAVHTQPRSASENIRSGGAAKFEKAFMDRRMNGVPLGSPDKTKAA